MFAVSAAVRLSCAHVLCGLGFLAVTLVVTDVAAEPPQPKLTYLGRKTPAELRTEKKARYLRTHEHRSLSLMGSGIAVGAMGLAVRVTGFYVMSTQPRERAYRTLMFMAFSPGPLNIVAATMIYHGARRVPRDGATFPAGVPQVAIGPTSANFRWSF